MGKTVIFLSIIIKKMKKALLLIFGFLVFTATISTSSCAPKVGCEINEQKMPQVDRNGKLSKKGGDSQLFNKKMRKRMGQ